MLDELLAQDRSVGGDAFPFGDPTAGSDARGLVQ